MSLTHEQRQRETAARRPSWHELRFIPDDNKVRVDCAQCGKPMYLPPSKVAMYQRCGPECSAAARRERVERRARPCETCNKTFVPRPWLLRQGMGRFCSQACNVVAREALNHPEVKARTAAAVKKARAEGRFPIRTGPDHHSWRGGPEAARDRRRIDGRGAEQLRRYRKANPDKVREFSQRRAAKMTGRLPAGSIKRIGEAQSWKCAICRVSVRKHYQMDHIKPIARGGEHAPRNIQLLCRTCNVRKNAKDPIDYMRSLGRLL